MQEKTVREDSMNKANNPFRTEWQEIISGKNKIITFVRNKIFSLMDVITRTILILIFQPRELPWLDYFGLSGRFCFRYQLKDMYKEQLREER